MAENIPNVHKIYKHLPLQGPPKFIQIGIFGLKIYHPTTLVKNSIRIGTIPKNFGTKNCYVQRNRAQSVGFMN
jgi:hypothetical protein